MTEHKPATEEAVFSLPVYEHRNSLYEELHTRPSPKIQSPCYISHLALIRDGNDVGNEYELVSALCQRFSVNPPSADASCFYQNFGGFEFRWERHTEFSTYTFIRPDDGKDVPDFALSFIPKDWLNQLQVNWWWPLIYWLKMMQWTVLILIIFLKGRDLLVVM